MLEEQYLATAPQETIIERMKRVEQRMTELEERMDIVEKIEEASVEALLELVKLVKSIKDTEGE